MFYAVISYYLDHQEQVENYLRQQEEEAEEVQRMIEASQPARPGMRQELLERKARAESNHAPTGQ